MYTVEVEDHTIRTVVAVATVSGAVQFLQDIHKVDSLVGIIEVMQHMVLEDQAVTSMEIVEQTAEEDA